MMEQKEYQGPIVVDARVSIASGGLHRYVGIDPISQDLDDNRDRLVLYQEGEMIALYRQRFWRAVETFNPRPLWQWQDEQRRAMSYEPTTPTVDRDRIRSAPQGRCVICDDHLFEAQTLPSVFAGTNPDGTPRLAHPHCWDNMRDHLWLSYGVDLDRLSEREWQARQAAKPKLGTPPRWD